VLPTSQTGWISGCLIDGSVVPRPKNRHSNLSSQKGDVISAFICGIMPYDSQELSQIHVPPKGTGFRLSVKEQPGKPDHRARMRRALEIATLSVLTNHSNALTTKSQTTEGIELPSSPPSGAGSRWRLAWVGVCVRVLRERAGARDGDTGVDNDSWVGGRGGAVGGGPRVGDGGRGVGERTGVAVRPTAEDS
jgi:hypothetical protein